MGEPGPERDGVALDEDAAGRDDDRVRGHRLLVPPPRGQVGREIAPGPGEGLQTRLATADPPVRRDPCPPIPVFHERVGRVFTDSPQSLRTGRPTSHETFGFPFFEFPREQPGLDRLFDTGVAETTRTDASLLTTVLGTCPQAVGAPIAQPHVPPAATRPIEAAGPLLATSHIRAKRSTSPCSSCRAAESAHATSTARYAATR